MATLEKIDWSECPFVEVKAGVQSGAPVLLGTRMPVSAIVDNFDFGVSVAEIVEQFEIPQDRIEAILTYAKSHRICASYLTRTSRLACGDSSPNMRYTLSSKCSGSRSLKTANFSMRRRRRSST
jgi:uncharacterized protein (DUF433 family)